MIPRLPWAPSQPRVLTLQGGSYEEVKDPCPVLLDGVWHLYGTGVTGPDQFEILHASSRSLESPAWRAHAPIELPRSLSGSGLAAPGMIVDGREVHMFLQTTYNELGGSIEHLVSRDGGITFEHHDTALRSEADGSERGIYDAHPAEIRGQRYLTYSAFSVIGEPDIHLARSVSRSWSGPWEQLGAILTHEEVPFHNKRGTQGYEWGLEGPQLLELRDGRVMLNAVGFLDQGRRGSRQRLFTSLAARPEGPYKVIGPIPALAVCRGENGHATAVYDDGELHLFLAQRDHASDPWRYGVLRSDEKTLSGAVRS